MIDRIISFICYFPANLCFHIAEYEFSGLYVGSGDDFPWAGRKERIKFLRELTDGGSEADYERFLYWDEKWELVRIHKRFSLGFFSQILLYCSLFYCSIPLLIGSLPGLIVGAVVVLLFMLAKYLINKSVSRLYFNLKMTRLLVDMLKDKGNNTNQAE